MENLINFEEEYNKEKPDISFERGITEVPLSDITGSVGRYRDFENSELLKDPDSNKRMEDLELILKTKGEFEPVELYKLKDNYYILDGHHRCRIARENGLEKIKARVIEYLPPKNSFENILTWERSRFERMTGLSDIKLTELYQYEKLLDQIREHKHYKSEEKDNEVPFSDAAKDWHDTVYLPITKKICGEKLMEQFPERTIADLYTFVSDYKWNKSEKRGHDIGFENAISELKGKEFLTVADFFKLNLPSRHTKRMKVFNIKTGLNKIFLSKDYSYTLLLKQIMEHKYFMGLKSEQEISLQEAARDWYNEVYKPVTILISKENLPLGFASKTTGDIYLMLTEKKWLESEKKGYDVGFLEAVRALVNEKKSSNFLNEMIKTFLTKIIFKTGSKNEHS